MIYEIDLKYNKDILNTNYNEFKHKISSVIVSTTIILVFIIIFVLALIKEPLFIICITILLYLTIICVSLCIYFEYRQAYKTIISFIKQEYFCYYDENLSCVFNMQINPDTFFQIGTIGFNIKIVYKNINTGLLDLNENCLYLPKNHNRYITI